MKGRASVSIQKRSWAALQPYGAARTALRWGNLLSLPFRGFVRSPFQRHALAQGVPSGHCLAALHSPSTSLFSSVLVPLALRLPWAVRALRVGALLAISSLSFKLRKWVSVGKLWRRCSWTHSHLFNVIRVWPGKCHRHTEHRLNQHQMLMKMTISRVDCCALCTPWHVTEFLVWLYALVQPQVAMESRGGRQLVHQGIKWYRLIQEFNTRKKASEVLSCIDSALHTTVKAKISLPL